MNYDKYPKAKKFMQEHPGWTLDQAIEHLSKQLEGDEI